MNTANSLSILTAKLQPRGQQRLFEFLDGIDTATAARFRSWLSAAPEAEVNVAADLLNRASHGREFAGWWSSRDRKLATTPVQTTAPSVVRPHLENRHAPRHSHGPNRDLATGAAWLGGGLLVTIGSYTMATSSPGGGYYLVAYGAILYGAVRLLRGLKNS